MSLRLCLLMSLVPASIVNASQFHIQMENDVTFGEDGNYSNGMIIGWESNASLNQPQTTYSARNWLLWLLPNQPDSVQACGLKVSQRMWTPSEINIEQPQADDRPYAGLLEFEQHTALYRSDIAQKNWLSIGVMGPASKAEQLQGAIHNALGSSTPLGWQHQVENTLTMQFAYEIDYLLVRSSAPFNSQWELSTFNHSALGNMRSDLNFGLTFRWGTKLEQTFGRLSSHFGHVGNLSNDAPVQSLLFFTRMQTGYRFNDLTIDGKLPFQSTVEFNPMQASAATGVSYFFYGGSATWSFNVYNKEYLTDNKSWHGFGLLQFTWSI